VLNAMTWVIFTPTVLKLGRHFDYHHHDFRQTAIEIKSERKDNYKERGKRCKNFFFKLSSLASGGAIEQLAEVVIISFIRLILLFGGYCLGPTGAWKRRSSA
jgi:hypothetical protein